MPVWIEQVTSSYTDDFKWQELITKLSIDPAVVQYFTLQSGILRYKGRVLIGNAGQLKMQLLESFHKSALVGHSGERATYQRLKSVFYWPQMHKQVKEFVRTYHVCQKNKAEHNPYPGLLGQLPIPDMAWTHISMDFVEGLPKSNNKDVILVIVDRFTKYAHFLPLSHPFTVQDVITLFLENIFKLHGISLLSSSLIEIEYSQAIYGKLYSNHWELICISVQLTNQKQMDKLRE